MQVVPLPGQSADEGLIRALGLGSAVLLVIGSVIGSGIFLTTGGMAALIPSPTLLLADRATLTGTTGARTVALIRFQTGLAVAPPAMT